MKGKNIDDDLRVEIFEYIEFMIKDEIDRRSLQYENQIEYLEMQVEDMVSLFKKIKPTVHLDGELKRDRLKKLVNAFAKKYNIENRKIYSYFYRELMGQGISVYNHYARGSILDSLVLSGRIHSLYRSSPGFLKAMKDQLKLKG